MAKEKPDPAAGSAGAAKPKVREGRNRRQERDDLRIPASRSEQLPTDLIDDGRTSLLHDTSRLLASVAGVNAQNLGEARVAKNRQ